MLGTVGPGGGYGIFTDAGPQGAKGENQAVQQLLVVIFGENGTDTVFKDTKQTGVVDGTDAQARGGCLNVGQALGFGVGGADEDITDGIVPVDLLPGLGTYDGDPVLHP